MSCTNVLTLFGIIVIIINYQNTYWLQPSPIKMSHRKEKQMKTKLRLTCLFLSSVIRWIWIFFLPMMLCSCGDKCRSQSSGEAPLRGCERKCSLLPLTSAQKHSDTVMHPRAHAHTHFSAQVWWGNAVDPFCWRAARARRVGAAEMCDVLQRGGPQFIVCSTGTKVTNFPAAAVVKRTSLLSCRRQRDRKVTQISHKRQNKTCEEIKSMSVDSWIDKSSYSCHVRNKRTKVIHLNWLENNRDNNAVWLWQQGVTDTH